MALTEITPQNSPGGAGLLRRSHCLKLKIQRELDSPRANGHDWLQKAGQGDDAKDRIDLCDSLDPNLGRRFESPERRAHPVEPPRQLSSAVRNVSELTRVVYRGALMSVSD